LKNRAQPTELNLILLFGIRRLIFDANVQLAYLEVYWVVVCLALRERLQKCYTEEKRE